MHEDEGTDPEGAQLSPTVQGTEGAQSTLVEPSPVLPPDPRPNEGPPGGDPVPRDSLTTAIATIVKMVDQLIPENERVVHHRLRTCPIRKENKFSCVVRALRATETLALAQWAIYRDRDDSFEAVLLARAAVQAAVRGDEEWVKTVARRIVQMVLRKEERV